MVYWIFLIFAFMLGMIVGSFLNVVIYRLPRENLSIHNPKRSHCVHCGYRLRWYDNIPIFSFLFLKGRCRACRKPISIRYPLVEGLTGSFFLLFAWLHFVRNDFNPSFEAWLVLVIHFAFISALIALTFIDFDFRILPDRITKPGIVLAPILSLFVPKLQPPLPFGIRMESAHLAALVSSLSGVLFGAAIIFLTRFFGKLIFRKEAMGFGDLKLMALIGGIVGPSYLLPLFFIGCLTGTAVGIPYLLLQGKGKGKKKSGTYIPFGPFLSLGALTCALFGQEVLYFLKEVWPRFVQQNFL